MLVRAGREYQVRRWRLPASRCNSAIVEAGAAHTTHTHTRSLFLCLTLTLFHPRRRLDSSTQSRAGGGVQDARKDLARCHSEDEIVEGGKGGRGARNRSFSGRVVCHRSATQPLWLKCHARCSLQGGQCSVEGSRGVLGCMGWMSGRYCTSRKRPKRPANRTAPEDSYNG